MEVERPAVPLPISEEVLSVDKQIVEGRHVRVRTIVEERGEVLHETLRKGVVDVQRVPVGEFVNEAPQVREEGDLLIVPVVEERLVVDRRLFLVEEVRLRHSIKEIPADIPETRRVMRAVVEDLNDQQQGSNDDRS